MADTTLKQLESKLEKVLEELKTLPKETLGDHLKELDKKVGASFDAVKELTKVTSDLVKEWEKWRKAGKF